jgi:hypothetical protein
MGVRSPAPTNEHECDALVGAVVCRDAVTSETSNLILEQLRVIRADVADVKSSLSQRIDAVTERVDSMDTQLHGLTYIVTTAVGSLAIEIKGLMNRVEALENA